MNLNRTRWLSWKLWDAVTWSDKIITVHCWIAQLEICSITMLGHSCLIQEVRFHVQEFWLRCSLHGWIVQHKNLQHDNFVTQTSCPRSSTELDGSSRNLLTSQRSRLCTPHSNRDESVNFAGNWFWRTVARVFICFDRLTIRTTVN